MTVSTLPGHSQQVLGVRIGAAEVFRGTVNPGAPQEIQFQLPKQTVPTSATRITFTFSQYSTVQETNGQDLAVAFHRLQVQ
jgi:hypothetical protein